MMARSKYGAVRTNGYASKAEAAYGSMLDLMAIAGACKGYDVQPRVPLVAGIVYVPDFLVHFPDESIYVDVKGYETPVFKLKAKLWTVYGPGLLRLVKREGRGFVVTKEIPGGKS